MIYNNSLLLSLLLLLLRIRYTDIMNYGIRYNNINNRLVEIHYKRVLLHLEYVLICMK